MMKGKLIKSLFRGKGVPRTPGRPGLEGLEGDMMEDDAEAHEILGVGVGGGARLRVQSEEHTSTNSLDSPNSESPRSWPSTFTTPMSYIKERKKRKASKFHITSPYDGDKSEENVFGAVEHNLSQSIHSDNASFVSFNDSPADEESDGVMVSKAKGEHHYNVQYQQLKLQVEVQQKIISDYEAAKLAADRQMADLSAELARKEQETKVFKEEVHGKKRLEILLQDMREKLQHLECENRNLQERLNENSPLTDHQKELLLQNRIKSCSAPPSIMGGSAGGLADSGEELSNEWEVKSSGGSSVHSEVSVACLQDKLVQMEENNYSTHEELQATLQELTDLQHQLEELQTDNRTLGDEKALLYESLCEQTEKLEACRSQLESTRQLLLTKQDTEPGDRMERSEKEDKLMDVLKSAQDERDRLDRKCKELASSVEEMKLSSENVVREMSLCQERMAFLERTLHTNRKEKEDAEREAQDLKKDLSYKNMELSRLKSKLEELEAAHSAHDADEKNDKHEEERKEDSERIEFLNQELLKKENKIKKMKAEAIKKSREIDQILCRKRTAAINAKIEMRRK